MKFNLKSLALCAAMLSFGFADCNEISYDNVMKYSTEYGKDHPNRVFILKFPQPKFDSGKLVDIRGTIGFGGLTADAAFSADGTNCFIEFRSEKTGYIAFKYNEGKYYIMTDERNKGKTVDDLNRILEEYGTSCNECLNALVRMLFSHDDIIKLGKSSIPCQF